MNEEKITHSPHRLMHSFLFWILGRGVKGKYLKPRFIIVFIGL